MSNIVDIVKELGIKPNPNMSIDEAKKILAHIKKALKNKMPLSKQYRIESDFTLKEMIYTFQKQVERPVNQSVYEKATHLFKDTPNGIICRTQNGLDSTNGFNPNDDFVWQITPNCKSFTERFACDIDICSPHFPQTLEKLRTFIAKHQSGFKIPYFGHEGRSDTLNCYMTKPITPEIATEFYQIVKPCLKEDFHEKLDGLPIYANGKMIKGIKIGPEYKTSKNGFSILYQQQHTSLNGLPASFKGRYVFFQGSNNDTKSSLGYKCASIEVHQLAYYLAGLEGKCPYRLLNSDLTEPYKKQLDIGCFLSNDTNNKNTPHTHQNQSKDTLHNLTKQALHFWAFKAAPYFDVKNGILYLKEDLSAFDKFDIKQLKLKETLGISAKALKKENGDIYAYAPNTLDHSNEWQAVLKAVQSYQSKGEPKEISQNEALQIAYTASQDFKADNCRLLFRDLEKKQTHTGLNAYGSYNSLIGLLREKYNIRYTPINEQGTCIGFKIIGNKSRKALHHLFEALKNPEKYDTMRYTKHTTATSFGR